MLKFSILIIQGIFNNKFDFTQKQRALLSSPFGYNDYIDDIIELLSTDIQDWELIIWSDILFERGRELSHFPSRTSTGTVLHIAFDKGE